MRTRDPIFPSDPGLPFPLSGPQFPFDKKKAPHWVGVVWEQVCVRTRSCLSMPFGPRLPPRAQEPP